MIIELKHSFTRLEQALQQLSEALLAQTPSHWLPLTQAEQDHSNSLTVLTELISTLRYQNEQQDGRVTAGRHGLVLVDANMVEQISCINSLKDEFKQLVVNNRKELSPPQWRDAMQSAGLARIHLRQCYRHLPLINEMPIKVGFSWYVNGRSIRKLTIAQAEQALLALGEDKPHIQAQLQKLYALESHTQLAQIQTLAPVVRANLVFNQSKRAMNAPLPLFLQAADCQQSLPEYNPLDLTAPEGRTRKARADQKIELEPYLPSIRAHLYRL